MGNPRGNTGKGSKGVEEISPLYPTKNSRTTWMNWISLNLVFMEPIVYKGNATV